MNNPDTKDVKKKIRTLFFHVGALQGSYPQVLEDPDYAHAHLLVLRKVLPYMMHVLRFSSEMIPVIEKVIGVAGQGSTKLGDVSKNLRNIDTTAENAVQQIMTGLEDVEGLLRKVQEVAGAGEDVEEAVDAASMQLMSVFSALQFQDITSQKIEATHALLAQLEGGLNSLVKQLGMPVEGPEIEVHEGTFDAHAEYDVEKAKAVQDAVDAVVEAAQEAAEDSPSGEGTVDQGDIDALINGGAE
jgi:chemotaxis regulatin CheY-phosphate phosphatase CheZ